MPEENDPRLAFSPREFARRTGVSHDFIYAAIASGQLVARKWGRRTLILATDARRYLENLPRMQSAVAPKSAVSAQEACHD
jgi:excisionase family DNA binding protein